MGHGLFDDPYLGVEMIETGGIFYFLSLVMGQFTVPKCMGGKISPNPFVHPNPPILLKSKPTQLLIGLNGYQPN